MNPELPRLLIVDDEPTNVQVLAEALKGEYRIQFCLNGKQTLARAKEQQIDLILLDVVMPDIDGFDVLRRLKADPATQGIPVIFVTAADDEVAEARGLRLGAVDYVFKPFRPAVVRARIDTHLEIKRQRELLERYAMIDGLTEIANRRRFDDELDRRWRAAARSGEAVTLIIVDVDQFKPYNDQYGHAVGDRCLRRVAQQLAQSFGRGNELVARYGGEEFAILTSHTDRGQLQSSLQQLVDGVHELGIEHRASEKGRVTISAGAARMIPGQSHPRESLIERADRQLYRAKNEGRNRACIDNEGDQDCFRVFGPESSSAE